MTFLETLSWLALGIAIGWEAAAHSRKAAIELAVQRRTNELQREVHALTMKLIEVGSKR